MPPVLLKGVAVTFHDLKHDCETSVRSKDKQEPLVGGDCGAIESSETVPVQKQKSKSFKLDH